MTGRGRQKRPRAISQGFPWRIGIGDRHLQADPILPVSTRIDLKR